MSILLSSEDIQEGIQEDPNNYVLSSTIKFHCGFLSIDFELSHPV
jgi:hypothetical protein